MEPHVSEEELRARMSFEAKRSVLAGKSREEFLTSQRAALRARRLTTFRFFESRSAASLRSDGRWLMRESLIREAAKR
jgi:hypothetical protein